METLEILDIIMTRTMPVVTVATIFLIAQVLISSFFEVKFFYQSIQNRSIALKIAVCMVPAVFIITYCIVTPLIMGSFVAGGMSDKSLTHILQITLSYNFLTEMLLAIVCLFLLAFIYKTYYHLNKVQMILSFGFEVAISVCLVLIYGGLFIENSPFSIITLIHSNILFVAYAMSGYFIILYKLILTFISLLAGIVFRDKEDTIHDFSNEVYSYKDQQNAVLRFINYRQKTLGVVYFITSLSLFFIIILVGLNDMDLAFNWNNISLIILEFTVIMLPFAFLFILAMINLFFAFFPRITRAYRTLAKST